MEAAINEQPKPKTVCICTPMYNGDCKSNYVIGLVQTIDRLRAAGYAVYVSTVTNESLITRARNDQAALVMENGFDYLMFIDADIGFDGQAVLDLIAADEDIVCAAYPRKEVDWKNVLRAAKQGKENLADYAGSFVFNFSDPGWNETNAKGLISIRHGGTGFMLIKRAVLDKMAPTLPSYRKSAVPDENGVVQHKLVKEFFSTAISKDQVLLSEDYLFCERWLDMGGKVYLNPFIKLAHVGTYVYTGDLVEAGGNVK